MKSPRSNTRARRRPGRSKTPPSSAINGSSVIQLELELDTLRDELSCLEESRQQYADLYDFAPVGYLSMDRQGCIHVINLTGARLLGQRRDTLMGKPLLPFVAASDRRKFLTHLMRLKRGQKEVSTELELGFGRHLIPAQLISVRLRPSRAPAEFRTIIVDLTERRRADAALRESEARFRMLADAAPVMIWITGPDNACTYVNEGWLEFTGRRLEQELGHGWTEGVHPDDVVRCLESYTSAFEERRPFQMEYRVRRADGEYRWVLDNGTPRFAALNKFLGFIGSCIDITEHRNAETVVRTAEAQLRLVTDIAPVMLVRCCRDRRYQFVNQAYANFLGRTQQEIVGRTISESLNEASCQAIGPYIEKVLAGHFVEFQIELPLTPEHPRFVHTAYSPEWDAQGAVVGWVAAITDITERKQAERRLQVRDVVTRELAEVATVREAAPKILEALCELTHWDTGALWLVGPEGGSLDCVGFWHAPELLASEFEADTRQRHFIYGTGVVGKVWRTGHFLFIPELAEEPDFVRSATAVKAGLRSGFCFPIKSRNRVLGTIECYSRRHREKDDEFTAMLASVGDKLGTFIERKLAEEALRQGEERLRSVLETSLDAIITVDGTGTISGWNPQAAQIFGWTPQEAIGRKLVELAVPLRHRPAYEQALRNYLHTGKSPLLEKRVEHVALHRDGREFPVEVAITPLRLEGRLTFSAFVRDITARKEAEEILRRSHNELEQHVRDRTAKLTEALEALRASETRFRGFVESAPDAIVIADEKGRIVLVNAQTERLFGFSRNELEGQPADVLIPKRFRGLHRISRTQYGFETPSRPLGVALELFGLRKDDTEFPIEISLSPLPTPSGTLVCSAIRDITERKRAEQALRDGEQRLTAIMEHTPALMFLKDKQGHYLHFNRQFAQTFHLDLKTMLGKTDANIFPRSKAALFRANDAKVLRTRAPIQFEIVTDHEDGPHTSIVTKFPLFTSEGEIYAVGGIVTDITDRKRVEKALEQSKGHYLALFKEARTAQQESRKLATLVLHAQEKERKRVSRELHDDVGQSLNVVNMSLAALKKKVEQGSPLEAAQLGEIQRMLEQTMEKVHGFARELRPTMLDELGLLPALRSHLEHLAEQTGLNVQLEGDPTAEELGGEEKLVLFRVAQESLNNVVKHADASRVRVAIRKTGNGVTLMVTDNGKSFQSDSNNVSRDQRLGLLGMRERVRLVNGHFAILPRPGKGTRVRVTIPVKAPVPAELTNGGNPLPAPAP